MAVLSLREATDRLRETWFRATGRTQLAEELRAERAQSEYLAESLADLESRMYEPGWQLLTAKADQEFTREGLTQITAVTRVMAIKNPLIKRGLALRQAYVWGQGLSITARDDDVQDVISGFLDDESNQRTFTSATAREELERALGTDGNLFFALFTSPRSGRVQVRVLPWDEITDVITNPEDASEPWFYQRDWWVNRRDPISGGIITERRIAYYPALGYRPRQRPPRIRDVGTGQQGQIMWDAPTLHVKVNGLLHWKFGVGDAYAAIDWANAYREFLTDWARLVKSLSRFAWRLTTRGSKQAQAKTRLATAPTTDPTTGEARRVGATALLTPEMALEAIPKSGATIDSESGRPLAAMVATALDVPVTMLLGDPGTTGARATAETLDTPTERAMQQRRGVWAGVLHQVLSHVIAEAVRAPDGPLTGTITVDETGRQTVTLDGDAPATVDIAWPDLDDVDVAVIVKAIVEADATGRMPPEVTARLLLEALGVKDVDGILANLVDEQGRWIGPDGPDSAAAQAALDAFRRGQDPAAVMNGDPRQIEAPQTNPEDDDGPAGGDQG